MALIPTLFRNWWEDLERPHRLLDQNFGLGLTRDDLMNTLAIPSFRGYYRPWRNLQDQTGGVAKIQDDKDKFQVILDVQQFAPNEITVKTIDNNIIVVEGKHEEKKDEHGFVSRQFSRRYVLPQGHDIGQVQSTLSSDGVLSITAPKLALPAPGEKIVPIQQSPAPAIKSA